MPESLLFPSTDAKVGTFRAHLPDLSDERFSKMRRQNAHEYAKQFKEEGNPPWIYALYRHWQQLLAEPYKGITTDGKASCSAVSSMLEKTNPVRSGHVRPNLFHLEDQGIEIDQVVAAAEVAIAKMSQEQRNRVIYHIDSPEWRTWSNPEFLLSDKGIRLDEITDQLRDAVLRVLQESLSPEGFSKAVAAMRINGFLGELVDSPAVMNEWSYNFVMFGEKPSTTQAWGFSFYGHHLCLNAFFYKKQIVLSPWFTGAEPNLIDQGKYIGTQILRKEEALGLKLMQSLPPALQLKAQVYKLMQDPEMPRGRWNHDDQRHLCGAYRDNRIVPCEGILIADLLKDQQDLVTNIFREYLVYLPQTARDLTLSRVKELYGETYFCWIGGYGEEDPFYYRLQSPTIIVEFDHHSGVFLTNKEPAKYHIHTLLRMPNGGDYGMAIRKLIPGAEQEFQWDGDALLE